MKLAGHLLQIIGSLGLFLYGMTLLSESLQKVAGDRMRTILASMTSNSFKRVLTGVLITAIIQSSSATTVMAVSFVNAGLLSLVQSVGVIMGANVGTTVTAWIITLLGFKADISILSIPLIGVGFVFMMLKSKKKKAVGELIMGFALLFLGLSFLKSSIPDLAENPEVLQFISEWTDYGFISTLIFVLIGTLLTIILQSSSATVALTLVMTSYGWIPFEMAGAMVLGENLGTTITANIAAAVANVSARRAALAHTLFNVFGVVWILFLFTPVLNMVASFTAWVGAGDPFTCLTATTYGVTILHTFFNLATTLILIWFVPQIVRIVTYVIKDPETEEVFRLQYIQGGLLSTSELSLTQAKHEIVYYAELAQRQFGYVRQALHNSKGAKFDELYEKLEHYEQVMDRVELEIAAYLTSVSEGEISKISGKRIQAMYKIISEMESMGDSGYNIARIIQRRNAYDSHFNEEIESRIVHMLDLLDRAFEAMISNLQSGYTKVTNIKNAEDAEESINQYRDHLKEEHLLNLNNNIYDYQTGVFYMDFIAECEKVGDYIINVSEAILEIK